MSRMRVGGKVTRPDEMSPLEVARAFMGALRDRRVDRALELCAGEIEVWLPGAETPLRGKAGVRQMLRLAPSFVHSVRSEQEDGSSATVTTLTRLPGTMANYTTWTFETADGKITRLGFHLRAAN